VSPAYRVAMVAACPFPSPRGTPVRVQRMSEALARAGHDIHVVTYHLGSGEPGNGLRVHRTPSLPTYRKESPGPSLQKLLLVDPLLAVRLARVVREHPVDLIHAHHYEGLIVACTVARWSGHPVIYDAHTLLESELGHYLPTVLQGLASKVGRWLDTLLPRRADHVISVSTSLRDKLLTLGSARPESITVIGNGVERSHFQSAPARQRGGLPAKLIFTGNLAPYQGIELLLRAFARIRARNESVHLEIVTESPFDPYEPLARELGVWGAMDVIPGGFKDLPVRLAQADIALNPRTSCDGVPLKLLNYMSAAMPIVSFAGSAHYLENDRSGRLVPDGDLDAFADAVLDLIDHPELARRLGQNAQQHSDAYFSWPNAVQRVETVYQEVLEKRRKLVPAARALQATM
jgi:glycosyltransferase involved in cell wall biosynthesis